MSSYRIVFRKACHLPVELEHSLLGYPEEKNFKLDRKCLKLIAGKLRSRWDGPFVITNVFPYVAVELKDEHTNSTFQVNGHKIKLFHEGPVPPAAISLLFPIKASQAKSTPDPTPSRPDSDRLYLGPANFNLILR
ncbi:hypothetical protein CR513_21602, partial [Mucuna pruriens]